MSDSVEILRERMGASWPSIIAAREASRARLGRLRELLADVGTTDAAIVVCGSLARLEWTSGSDLDWTLLVNGPADRTQWNTVHQIRERITEELKGPTPGGAFGSMAFCHELLHRIGGEADTNRITTQRVLLLLESVAVGSTPNDPNRAHDGVIRAILDAYLGGPDTFVETRVPRLLLNDVVRYWRTMAVDFAAKLRERGADRWALRLLKLRTSRKLLFSAGLIMALDRVEVENEGVAHPDQRQRRRDELLERLVSSAHRTPLDRVARIALDRPQMERLARPVFDWYDQFLTLIGDEENRKELEAITTRDEAESNDTYRKARDIGRGFGQAIEDFFFGRDDAPSVFSEAIRKYGVF